MQSPPPPRSRKSLKTSDSPHVRTTARTKRNANDHFLQSHSIVLPHPVRTPADARQVADRRSDHAGITAEEGIIMRPILFSDAMVRAILDGRKTQTRRVVMEPVSCSQNHLPHSPMVLHKGLWLKPDEWSPYGTLGDHLWVRETWGAVSPDEYPCPLEKCKIEYRADLPIGSTDYPGGWPIEEARGNDEAPKWRPSIYMPRWASRITLEIVSVNIERLQQIMPDDVEAEGTPFTESQIAYRNTGDQRYKDFEHLWNSINSTRGYDFDANPWVWVIGFKRIQP